MKRTLYIEPYNLEELMESSETAVPITNSESEYLFLDSKTYIQNLVKVQLLHDLSEFSLKMSSKRKAVYSFNFTSPELTDYRNKKITIDTEEYKNKISYEELKKLHKKLSETLDELKGRYIMDFAEFKYKDRMGMSKETKIFMTNPVINYISNLKFIISDKPAPSKTRVVRNEDGYETEEEYSWIDKKLSKFGFHIEKADLMYDELPVKKMSYENTIDFLESYTYLASKQRLSDGNDIIDINDPASKPPKLELLNGINFGKISEFERAKLTEKREDTIHIGNMMMYPEFGEMKKDNNGKWFSKYGKVFEVGGVPLSVALATELYFERINFTRTLLVLGGVGSGKTEWSKAILANSFKKMVKKTVPKKNLQGKLIFETQEPLLDEEGNPKTNKEGKITYQKPEPLLDDNGKQKVDKLGIPLYTNAKLATMVIAVEDETDTGEKEFLSNRILIHDLKGDYLQYLYRHGEDIIFNMADARGTPWDIFEDFTNNPALIEAFAKSMVLAAAGGEENEWINFATKEIAKAITEAQYFEYPPNIYEEEESESEGLSHASRLNKAKWMKMVALLEFFRDDAIENKRTTEISMWANIDRPFTILREIAYQVVEENRPVFSIKHFLESKDIRLFLLNNPSIREKLTPIFSAFVSCTVNQAMAGGDTKTDLTTFLLDEFLSLNLDEATATSLFTAGRSKGLQTILMAQMLPNDEASKKMLQLISSSRYALHVFGINDSDTLKLVSEAFGDIRYQAYKIETVKSENIQKNSNENTDMSMNTAGINFQQSAEVKSEKLIPEADLARIPKFHHILHVPKESLASLVYMPAVELPIVNEAYEKTDAEAFNHFIMNNTFQVAYDKYVNNIDFNNKVESENTENDGQSALQNKPLANKLQREISERNKRAKNHCLKASDEIDTTEKMLEKYESKKTADALIEKLDAEAESA